MAARKAAAAKPSEPPAHEVEAVSLDGVEVQVDLTYVRSWAAARQLGAMTSGKLADGERFAAMVDYYAAAIPNVDEVAGSLGGEMVEASAVFEFLGRAVREVTPKN